MNTQKLYICYTQTLFVCLWWVIAPAIVTNVSVDSFILMKLKCFNYRHLVHTVWLLAYALVTDSCLQTWNVLWPQPVVELENFYVNVFLISKFLVLVFFSGMWQGFVTYCINSSASSVGGRSWTASVGSKKERKCNDLKCVRKPTKSRLSLTHHANKSSRWAE